MEEYFIREKLHNLKESIEGDIITERAERLMYATDASVYREIPLAIVRPRSEKDIIKLVQFAAREKLPLIPRAAGTSLAGQVVGAGIIVDVSRYMNAILEVSESQKWVKVQPGVVLDELNLEMARYGLFFGPETSTSNRCMMGGMVGNNACGAHSLVYGSTRDHTIEVKAILSDGSEAVFGPMNKEGFESRLKEENLEGRIYRMINKLLSDESLQEEIRKQYPDPAIKRRNTGYALDLLLDTAPFTDSTRDFNFAKLIAGSEGTLAFITEIKLNLVELPPPVKGLLCVHCETLEEAFKGNLIALKHGPVAIELMDRVILECTRNNINQRKNRFFVKGDPGAILLIEFAEKTQQKIEEKSQALIDALKKQNMGYHYPLLFGDDIGKVWSLRKAGLGLLSNVPGDAKPVAVIEDTAVNPEFLPDYMADFQDMLEKLELSCVYYAHIATGELHLRPVLNLKNQNDVELFRTVARQTAELVKKYRGSLSGEHGDGRLRGEFIAFMLGEKIYHALNEVKNCWDPNHIFNPQKIVNTPAMNTSLRYKAGQQTRRIDTYFDFSSTQGILRAVEQCNGSGDCRKSEIIGGVMCPSYMASKEEKTTTRARANILREFLTNSSKENPFDEREIYNVLDLCLSCKGCKSECPSNVDITKYKAEFLQHYYDSNGAPIRAQLIAGLTCINKLGMLVPSLFNFIVSNKVTATFLKKTLGFAPKRSIPLLYKTTLKAWMKNFSRKNKDKLNHEKPIKKVWLFADEFTDYNDVEAGIAAVKLLLTLGYEVNIPKHKVSGRTYLSKGFVRKARKLANINVDLLKELVSADTPLLGLEPSGILCFRDEYKELVKAELKEAADNISRNAYLIDEFIAMEFEKGNIKSSAFTEEEKNVVIHGHCYQKALSSVQSTQTALSIPINYQVKELKTGCCGMAGSFGYEKEHYNLSMKVGDLVLFPAIRALNQDTLIAAPGTSCRHQIKDGTGRKALHPVEILYEALVKK